MRLYHGTDAKIETLNAGAFLTNSLETAQSYGSKVYVFECDVDHDIYIEHNGMRYIDGFHKGQVKSLTKHFEYNIYETTSHVDLIPTACL